MNLLGRLFTRKKRVWTAEEAAAWHAEEALCWNLYHEQRKAERLRRAYIVAEQAGLMRPSRKELRRQPL